jgi:pentatricopeptide repeat protein
MTLSSGLKACGLIGAKAKGMEIHDYISQKGLLKKDVVLGTALVDMYAKCGLLGKAQGVFNTLPLRDVVLWNSLITGHARLGEIEDVLCLFERMRREGGKPNSITFVSVLNACSHAGLIERGHEYFEFMTKDCGIAPTIEHHTCMVDLLGRAGQIERAIATMKETTFHPNVVLWLTVLGSCRKWRNLELGRHAFEEVIKLDDKEGGAYVCMANMYVDANMHEHAMKIEAMRARREAWKVRKLQVQL